MSTETGNNLASLSKARADLVAQAASGVVAVKAGAYRTASGVLLPHGLVAVCHHSLRREGKIPVVDGGGRETMATIAGRHRALDVAILRVDDLAGTALPPCPPEEVRAGMEAAAIGMTSDVGVTASFGGVGAVGPARRTWKGGTIDRFIRLDLTLYPSQTGAAVVDVGGRLIGMATPAFSRHAAVAIPYQTLERIGNDLAAGRLRLGYLGVGTQRVAILKTLVEKHGLTQQNGLILLQVEADSPAERAGLLVGDVLLAADGKALTDGDELQTALLGKSIDSVLQLSILRGGEPAEVAVTIGERPE